MRARLMVIGVATASFTLTAYWIYIGNLAAVWPTVMDAYNEYAPSDRASHLAILFVWVALAVGATVVLVVLTGGAKENSSLTLVRSLAVPQFHETSCLGL